MWSDPVLRKKYQELEAASSLEDLIKMGTDDADGPLKHFPNNIDQNIYSDIIRYFLENVENTVSFFLNILVEKSKAVDAKDVIQMAFLLSYIAHSVSRGNDAVVKLKSLLLQKQGLTYEGLDDLAILGVTETGRSLRNQKEFLASISLDLVKSAASQYPYQSTIDNLGRMLHLKKG